MDQILATSDEISLCAGCDTDPDRTQFPQFGAFVNTSQKLVQAWGQAAEDGADNKEADNPRE